MYDNLPKVSIDDYDGQTACFYKTDMWTCIQTFELREEAAYGGDYDEDAFATRVALGRMLQRYDCDKPVIVYELDSEIVGVSQEGQETIWVVSPVQPELELIL